jgi:hypothetical protein
MNRVLLSDIRVNPSMGLTPASMRVMISESNPRSMPHGYNKIEKKKKV